MSAVVTYKGSDGIVVAADGVTYDDAGICRGFATKIHYLSNLDCVFAQVGEGGLLLDLLRMVNCKYQSFDEMLAGLSDDLLVTSSILHLNNGRFPRSTVAIAGWSDDRQQYAIYRISNWTKEIVGHDDAKAYDLMLLDGFWSNCNLSTDAMERYQINAGAMTRDPWRACARWICANRSETRGPLPEEDLPAFGVGGFVQVAVLRRRQFESHIVHRWPDEVGKLIDPGVGELVPDWMMPKVEPVPDDV